MLTRREKMESSHIGNTVLLILVPFLSGVWGGDNRHWEGMRYSAPNMQRLLCPRTRRISKGAVALVGPGGARTTIITTSGVWGWHKDKPIRKPSRGMLHSRIIVQYQLFSRRNYPNNRLHPLSGTDVNSTQGTLLRGVKPPKVGPPFKL